MDIIYTALFFILILTILSLVFKVIVFLWPILLGAFIGLLIYNWFTQRKNPNGNRADQTSSTTYNNHEVIEADYDVIDEVEGDQND